MTTTNTNFKVKNGLDAVGTITGLDLVSTQSSGNEGGEIRLATAATGSTLTAGTVTIDVYQNKLRFFETGGDTRGAYIDLTAAGAGVSSNLLAGGGGGGSGTVTSITAGTTGLTGGTITTSGTIDIDTTKVPLLTSSQTFTGTQTFIPASTTTKSAIFKTLANQLEDVIEIQNSSSTTTAGIGNNGQLYTGSTSEIYSVNSFSIAAASASSSTVATFTVASYYPDSMVVVGQKVLIAGFTSQTYFNGTFIVTAIGGSAGAYTFTVLGSGFTVASATQFGNFKIPAQLSVTEQAGATSGILIKLSNDSPYGGNPFEIQNGSGTQTFSISHAGNLASTSSAQFIAPIYANSFIENGTGEALVSMDKQQLTFMYR